MIDRLRAMALFAAMAFLPAPLAAEGPRMLSTADDNRGWEAVGRLNFGETGFCTAALVTPDVVMTAAHCLYERDTGRPVPAAEIEFQAGLRFGRAEAYRGVRRVVVHPDYDFLDADRLGRIGTDVALLELDRPVRMGHVKPFRTQFRVSLGQQVQVVSYAKSRPDAPSREVGCSVLTRDDEVLVLSCEVDFGSSGAPVFVEYEGGARIVSVISAKAEWEGQTVALAAVLEGEFDALLDAFASTPALNPVGKSVSVTGTTETAADE
jgi:V8-like Glu-specific endopeptidase